MTEAKVRCVRCLESRESVGVGRPHRREHVLADDQRLDRHGDRKIVRRRIRKCRHSERSPTKERSHGVQGPVLRHRATYAERSLATGRAGGHGELYDAIGEELHCQEPTVSNTPLGLQVSVRADSDIDATLAPTPAATADRHIGLTQASGHLL